MSFNDNSKQRRQNLQVCYDFHDLIESERSPGRRNRGFWGRLDRSQKLIFLQRLLPLTLT